ncbi:DUF2867 domain-containing protein [uncultured Shimia sp.]|uniref:DUF2867 domain-containing protein n=1 Tax=uncultured Shimia sp. TaxID=573152 RepID=UPI002610B359|nr:DUF2867 domain-containing protein [uncultured Shimia sp.]
MSVSFFDVTATPLPKNSKLHARFAPGDFLDCYSIDSDMPPRQAAEIVTNFPGWAQMLANLRTVLVKPFGLRTEAPTDQDCVGIFPVESESDTEVIAGFDDSHLNFRVSVLSEGGKVFVATWVHRNNLFGRMYLATIMPFHILIARDSLVRVARAT